MNKKKLLTSIASICFIALLSSCDDTSQKKGGGVIGTVTSNTTTTTEEEINPFDEKVNTYLADVNKYKSSDYRSDEQNKLAALKEEFQKAIDEARPNDNGASDMSNPAILAVAQAFEEFKTAADKLKTAQQYKYEESEDIRKSFTSRLDSEYSVNEISKYQYPEDKQIRVYIKNAKEEIGKLSDQEAIENVYLKTRQNISQLKTIEEIKVEDNAVVKDTMSMVATRERYANYVETYCRAIFPDTYLEADQATITKEATSKAKSIRNAGGSSGTISNTSRISTYLNQIYTNYTSFLNKVNPILTKMETELKASKDDALATINNIDTKDYLKKDSGEISDLKTNYLSLINNATTKEDVFSYKEAFVSQMSRFKTQTDLKNKKAAAKEEISKYKINLVNSLQGDKKTQAAQENTKVLKSIDTAETLEAVDAALSSYKANIDAICLENEIIELTSDANTILTSYLIDDKNKLDSDILALEEKYPLDPDTDERTFPPTDEGQEDKANYEAFKMKLDSYNNSYSNLQAIISNDADRTETRLKILQNAINVFKHSLNDLFHPNANVITFNKAFAGQNLTSTAPFNCVGDLILTYQSSSYFSIGADKDHVVDALHIGDSAFNEANFVTSKAIKEIIVEGTNWATPNYSTCNALTICELDEENQPTENLIKHTFTSQVESPLLNTTDATGKPIPDPSRLTCLSCRINESHSYQFELSTTNHTIEAGKSFRIYTTGQMLISKITISYIEPPAQV